MKRLACAALLCGSGPAVAQTALSLSLETTFAPVEEVESLSDALSCTALFRSMSLVFGPESDYFETFCAREGVMASVSGVLWADSPRGAGQSPDEVFTLLLPMINTATDLYVDHMDATVAVTDAPFDGPILAQFDFCTALVEALQRDAG
ncbi:hypothetical protein KUL25_07405 [Rhodobacteraceae bacterium N5(2021)]|uniref:Uncharacterized protein n=1 Tax=Gymnodinialimonas phycosphaerae TaxID=2841589 RepID=A0A975TY57_9RHOB|nr:hypothetical protein [Gymnodinialimonas phycosphaerae]MBY4892589.1 hypothetical protein [Gymnodinialimonas phycosphaerae]